ncbi:YkyA family protein [Bacillus sp. V5-8f]|uniref:YkyA family protein n=1 Tax=Bacillus sp. V5-8f TaxID=2053044 RepID=UPI0015E15365|nr:YkyA family protein [Bacillus sp. V5-8f]
MLKRPSLVAIIISITVFITGCSESPEEQIHTVLEQAVEKERGFEEQQAPITASEKKEKQLYEQIIGLSMKDFDQIVKLSDDALNSIEEREKLIEKEHKSITESEEAFMKVKDHIKNIEDKELKQRASELESTMEKRYAAHHDLYKSYKESLALDKELYGLFKQKDLKMDRLQEQINKINESYEKVLAANKTFNQETERYNKEKEAFYKSADIKVKESSSDKK